MWCPTSNHFTYFDAKECKIFFCLSWLRIEISDRFMTETSTLQVEVVCQNSYKWMSDCQFFSLLFFTFVSKGDILSLNDPV